MVFIGYAITTIEIAGCLFVRTPFDLFIVQAILGVSTAITTPAYDAIYSKKSRPRQRKLGMVILRMGTQIALGISAIIADSLQHITDSKRFSLQ